MWLWLAAALALWLALYRVLAPFAVWLTTCSDCGGAGLLGLRQAQGPVGRALAFFVYETPRVLLLLALVVFGVGVVRSFVTPARARRVLAGRRVATGSVLAALTGVVTPFCSCSAVPLFIGFVTAGVPLGVTFSILVAAPMVNEVALAMLWGLFGWKVALLYAGLGVAIAVGAGLAIHALRLERWVEPWVLAERSADDGAEEVRGWPARVRFGVEAVRRIVGRVWPYVLGGIAVGAGIHGWVPEGLLGGIMGRQAWWSVPAAVAIGVPMYANPAGILPVVQALLAKGAALGTALAFMMATIGLSLPEAVLLRRVLRPRLLALFFGIVAAGILVVGFVFNAVL
jgi:uncharacterized membrane protein YraQ (UPF0718 family)